MIHYFNMCGIIGYIGKRNAVQVALEGLKRLEYRGYDSAGVAFFTGQRDRGEKMHRENQGPLIYA